MNNIDDLFKTIQNRYHWHQNRIRTKFEIQKCYNYYFTDRRRISSWNENTNLIEFSLFQFNMELIPDFKENFFNLFTVNAAPLMKYFPEILKKSWHWQIISKEEYNIIAFFSDFCKKMKELTMLNEIELKQFFIMEDSFFKVTYTKRYTNRLIIVLSKIFSYQHINIIEDEDATQLLEKIEQFISPEYFSPSFYDYILAFNMVYYKKYLEWNSLMINDIKKLIPDEFFFCSKDIFEDIVKLINKSLKELEELEKEKIRLESLKNLSNINNDEERNKIISFYESLNSSWLVDSKDSIFLIFNLLEGLLIKINDIINKKWELVTDQQLSITANIIRDNKIAELYNKIYNEYELASGRYSVISIQKLTITEFFDENIIKNFLNIENHKYIYDKIIHIFSLFLEIAIIFNNYADIKDDIKNKHLLYLLVKPEEWCGKPVFGILQMYAEIILKICKFFKIDKLNHSIRSLPSIKNKIKSIKRRLEQFSDQNHFIDSFLRKDKNENVLEDETEQLL